MSRNSRGLAALLAGFGTGYLTQTQRNKDEERRVEKEKRDQESHEMAVKSNQMAIERQEKMNAQDAAVEEGLDEAAQMRVGQGVRTKTGEQIDTSEDAWKQRAIEQGADEATASEAAKVYAQKSGEKGAENWMNNSLDFGKGVRTTSQADIVRAQGLALSKGNRQDRMSALDLNAKADKLDIDDLKARIAKGTPESLATDYDEVFPDGFTLKFKTEPDGSLLKYAENPEGKIYHPEKFADLNQFKQSLIAMIDKDPATIQAYWDKSRELERANRKEARETKLTDAQLAKYEQDIKEGKIKLESLPESIRLDLSAKRANIAQSQAATESSRASTEKTREETKITKSTGSGKELPTSVREALWYQNASPDQKAAFDKMNDKSPKVTSDGFGGFIINKADGMYKMDEDGNVRKLNIPKDGDKTPPANRPPLSSFGK